MLKQDHLEWVKSKRAKVSSEESSPTESVDDSQPDAVAKEHKKLGKLSKFRISKVTKTKLKERGIKFLFPIQYHTFDYVYDGKDVIGQARTGTGKTLSFVLPLLERIDAEKLVKPDRGRPPFVLVMAPTRELANQVYRVVVTLTPHEVSSHCVYGGTPYAPQEQAFRSGLDFLVGTPGRILDHMRRGLLNLDHLRYFLLEKISYLIVS